MISADVKIGAKKEIKGLLAVSYNFSQKYLENLKYNVKQACISLNSIQLDVDRYKQGVRGFLLNSQNLLSITKAIG